MADFIELDGHKIDLDKYDLDMFFNANDGSRVSDEDWDVSAQRVKEAELLTGDDAITWQPV